MQIEMRPVAYSWDIEKEFGINVLECAFAQWAENESFILLWLDKGRVNKLWEYIKHYTDRGESTYVKLLENELDLINRFRAMDYADNILVFISF